MRTETQEHIEFDCITKKKKIILYEADIEEDENGDKSSILKNKRYKNG